MPKPAPPPSPANLSREEIARIEVGHTSVAPVTARLLLVCFLMAIAAVPVVELTGLRRSRAEGDATAWSHLSGLPGRVRAGLAGTTTPGPWQRVVSANRSVLAGLSGFERDLEHESLLGRSLRPPAQRLLTGWLGVGNERVYRGRDGWLFYRPDVEYVTGRGFLEPAQIGRRVAAAAEWSTPPRPDPREAITLFQRDLHARGIVLVVLPTPVKPGVHPEQLGRRDVNAAGVLQNPSYLSFVEDLRRDGVLVFDPSEALAVARRSGPQYMMTDTHWRPEAMEAVAEQLSVFIAGHATLPAMPDPGYRLERLEVRNTGDIARMLDLPEHRGLFPPEAVWLRRVLQPDGSLWRSSRHADVLLLGDSFTNIYSLESMGWGTSAGFAEQVSYVLRRPVDRLVQNDEGAYATRAMLQGDPGRLENKRVLVYQFAARELAFGDWKVIPVASRDPLMARRASPSAPVKAVPREQASPAR